MCINLHQTGFVGAGGNHLQLIKFWRSCVPGKGVCGGAKIFDSALLRPVCSVCVSPSAFFIYVMSFKCPPLAEKCRILSHECHLSMDASIVHVQCCAKLGWRLSHSIYLSFADNTMKVEDVQTFDVYSDGGQSFFSSCL